jgi:ABC-type amino acid transport substrate-binding protein
MKIQLFRLTRGVLSLLVGLLIATTSLADSLVVGLNPEYRPLVFKNEGQLDGIEPMMAMAVGKMMGREVEFKELEWEQLIPALERGEIDVIMSGMSVTEARQQQVDFTSSYMDIGQMAIIRMKDIGSLSLPGAMTRRGITIGVEPGTTGETYAKEKTAAIVKYYDNPQLAFAALRKGEIKFYIHDAPTSWKIAQSPEYGDLMPLYRALSQEKLAWAVKKGNKELLDKLNLALSELSRNGSIGLIQNHWIPVKVEVK